MRTTLDLDDEIVKQAKRRAIESGRSLTAVIEEALRDSLAATSTPRRPFKVRWVTVAGDALPGVDLTDRDSLYEIMDGRGARR